LSNLPFEITILANWCVFFSSTVKNAGRD
jgi:hypothetical protein